MTDENLRATIDATLLRALIEIQRTGAGYELVVDRLLNITISQIVATDGVEAVTRVFRGVAQEIEYGALDGLQAPVRVQGRAARRPRGPAGPKPTRHAGGRLRRGANP